LPAVPKNKRSKSKRDMRRNSFRLKALNIIECPRCHAKKIAHRVCQSCGYYNNTEIIQMEEKSKSKPAEKATAKSQTKSDLKKSTRTDKKEKAESESKQ
jgi:large subunit ribosomal protein L32